MLKSPKQTVCSSIIGTMCKRKVQIKSERHDEVGNYKYR